jgi:hypothetical protein
MEKSPLMFTGNEPTCIVYQTEKYTTNIFPYNYIDYRITLKVRLKKHNYMAIRFMFINRIIINSTTYNLYAKN